MKKFITRLGFVIGIPFVLCGLVFEFVAHMFVLGMYLYQAILDGLLGKLEERQ